MSSFALPRGSGSAFADLPPTLQPFAIAASAPRPDHLRNAGWSGLIYFVLVGGALAFTALAPLPGVVPVRPTKPERVLEFDGPIRPRLLERPSAPAGNTGGSSLNPAANAVVVPRTDSDQPAATLPTADRSGDLPGAYATPAGSGTPLPGPASPMIGAGPVIHDFTMVGLAVVHRVDPIYPAFARSARIQGPVVLMMTVDERGQPIQVQVLEGHPVFHEAALQAARQWRFEPARLDGRPVSAAFRLTLKFSLR